MHMGLVVKDLRMSKNWTISYLAWRAQVSRKAVYDVEKKGKGNIDTYERLLGAMGYELEVVKKDGYGLCG